MSGSFCTRHTGTSDLAHLLLSAAGCMHSHPPNSEGPVKATLPVPRAWDHGKGGLRAGCWVLQLQPISTCRQSHVGAGGTQRTILSQRSQWDLEKDMGEETEGVMSEHTEVRGGKEGSLEGISSKGIGACRYLLCYFCALLPGSTGFN